MYKWKHIEQEWGSFGPPDVAQLQLLSASASMAHGQGRWELWFSDIRRAKGLPVNNTAEALAHAFAEQEVIAMLISKVTKLHMLLGS